MKYYKEITLGDGRGCILRNPTAEDAEAIIKHMCITSDETDFMMRYGDEITMEEWEEAAYLSLQEESGNSGMICAIVDGRLVANGGFTCAADREKCRHRASFGISVRRRFWGLGIGTAIIEGIIELAKEAGYEQLELEVVSSNRRGMALYEKIGFEKCGTLPRAFKLRDGSYLDFTVMILQLNK